MNRRSFLILGATCAAGCAASVGANLPGEKRVKVVNAGPAAQYLADGVCTRYRDFGFFLVRRGANLFALSSICTHRHCQLESEPDRTFYCPCHGSTFDADGKVTEGPARRDLPKFEVQTNERGEVLVKVSGSE